MKVWRLVSGILSMVSFMIVTIQSCATGIVNVMDDNTSDKSDTGGFFVAFGLLSAGIVATIFWRKENKGGDIAIIILYGLTAIIGFTNQGTFSDLVFWSSWSLICAIMAAITLILHLKSRI